MTALQPDMIKVPTPSGLAEIEVISVDHGLAIHSRGLGWGVTQVLSGRLVATFPHRRHAWDFIRAIAVAVPTVVSGGELTPEDCDEIRRLVTTHGGRLPEEEG